MLAICRHDGILGVNRLHHADGDGFFTDVQMEKAANLAGAVELGAFFLEAADAQHLAQQMHGRDRASSAARSS